MEMCYDGALVMPSSYALMDEEEMTYVEGGGVTDVILNLLLGVVGGVVSTKIAPYCTLANFKLALAYCATAAKAVWAAVANAVAWVWNTPVALACVCVALGAAAGIMGTYCWYKYKKK